MNSDAKRMLSTVFFACFLRVSGRRTTAGACFILIVLSHASALVASNRATGLLKDGHWDGAITREGKVWAVSVDVESNTAPPAVLVDLVDYGFYALPFSLSEDSNKARLERKQPAGPSVLFEGTVEHEVFAGSFSGLSVTGASFVLRRGNGHPPLISQQDITFQNGEITLAGTVLIPPGVNPHPAIVCTHGAGPEGRHRPAYRSNGYFFARLGFVVLIYDKRGVGNSTGDFQTTSLEGLADDAIAGVRVLKSRKDVDPGNIGMTGVSQGGWVSPLAATRSSDVAFMLVISPSGINPMDQSVFDVENAMKKAGCPPETITRASELRKRLYATIRTGASDETFIAEMEKAHTEPWFGSSRLPYPVILNASEGERRFLLFEPIPTWEQVKVPVLALWGEEDQSVPALRSKNLVGEALARAGNRNFTLKIFPHADHTLSTVRSAADAWDFPRAAAGSRQIMADWLRHQGHQ